MHCIFSERCIGRKLRWPVRRWSGWPVPAEDNSHIRRSAPCGRPGPGPTPSPFCHSGLRERTQPPAARCPKRTGRRRRRSAPRSQDDADGRRVPQSHFGEVIPLAAARIRFWRRLGRRSGCWTSPSQGPWPSLAPAPAASRPTARRGPPASQPWGIPSPVISAPSSRMGQDMGRF